MLCRLVRTGKQIIFSPQCYRADRVLDQVIVYPEAPLLGISHQAGPEAKRITDGESFPSKIQGLFYPCNMLMTEGILLDGVSLAKMLLKKDS